MFTYELMNLVAGIDPGVKPSTDAPWNKNFVLPFIGHIVGTVIIVMVAVIVLGAVVWAFSKITGIGQGQQVGVSALVVAVIAVVIIGSASGMVMWFSGFRLFG